MRELTNETPQADAPGPRQTDPRSTSSPELVGCWHPAVLHRHGLEGRGDRRSFRRRGPFGVAIRYARQVVQDGTGKAPELAKEFVATDTFLLTYGDILVKPETYRADDRSLRHREFLRSAHGDAGRRRDAGRTELLRRTVLFAAPDREAQPRADRATSGGRVAQGGQAHLVQCRHLHF